MRRGWNFLYGYQYLVHLEYFIEQGQLLANLSGCTLDFEGCSLPQVQKLGTLYDSNIESLLLGILHKNFEVKSFFQL